MPFASSDLKIGGEYTFCATSNDVGEISDSFNLEVLVPFAFPKSLPMVFEIGGRIPRKGKFHVNGDGSLCLGARLRILASISKHRSISCFSRNFITPFLYQVSHMLANGKRFPLGELAHGQPGELDDVIQMLGLKDRGEALIALKCLGMKRREANRLLCPCSCGKKLANCRFNRRLNSFRSLNSRSWYRGLLQAPREVAREIQALRSFPRNVHPD